MAIVSQPCHYCDTVGNPFVGIDRKNNEPYYRVENSLPCCKRCNKAKCDDSYSDFMMYLEQIAVAVTK